MIVSTFCCSFVRQLVVLPLKAYTSCFMCCFPPSILMIYSFVQNVTPVNVFIKNERRTDIAIIRTFAPPDIWIYIKHSNMNVCMWMWYQMPYCGVVYGWWWWWWWCICVCSQNDKRIHLIFILFYFSSVHCVYFICISYIIAAVELFMVVAVVIVVMISYAMLRLV